MADLAQVLVDFSTKGAFPEDEAVSAAYIDNAVLPAALSILQSAKEELEVCHSPPGNIAPRVLEQSR